MKVFDFNSAEDAAAARNGGPAMTYTVIRSDAGEASPENPILVIRKGTARRKTSVTGVFTDPVRRTAFEFHEGTKKAEFDIVLVDARFTALVEWLGKHRIPVQLTGKNTELGYAVWQIREMTSGAGAKLSAEDGFLQFMIGRLQESPAPTEDEVTEDVAEDADLSRYIL